MLERAFRRFLLPRLGITEFSYLRSQLELKEHNAIPSNGLIFGSFAPLSRSLRLDLRMPESGHSCQSPRIAGSGTNPPSAQVSPNGGIIRELPFASVPKGSCFGKMGLVFYTLGGTSCQRSEPVTQPALCWMVGRAFVPDTGDDEPWNVERRFQNLHPV